MLLLQLFVDVVLSLVVSNPLYILNDKIKNLQITRNPDTYLQSNQIIVQYGYDVETHIIQTADGYLLQLDRIVSKGDETSGKKRQPVLLGHALIATSAEWLYQGPKSLGFVLADQGYDVWLINLRGSTYSTGHITLTPIEKQFWNFSIHEHGIYDFPATIDYIIQKTGFQQIIVIGHDISAAAIEIMCSTLPQYNEKIKVIILLGPTGAIPNSKSPLKITAPIFPYIYNFFEQNTPGYFIQQDPLNRFIKEILSSIKIPPYTLLDIIIFIGFGYDPLEYNKNVRPIFFTHFTAGTSVKVTAHLIQFTRSAPGSFAQFDYGKAGNIARYGTPEPSPYDVSLITAPVRVYYGTNDLLADSTDAILLYKKLRNQAGIVKLQGFNHQDFALALHLNILNDDIVKFLKKIK